MDTILYVVVEVFYDHTGSPYANLWGAHKDLEAAVKQLREVVVRRLEYMDDGATDGYDLENYIEDHWVSETNWLSEEAHYYIQATTLKD